MIRKTAFTITALLALLVAAAVAVAAISTYDGRIEHDAKSSIAVELRDRQGERSLKSFVAEDFLISCESGQARLERAAIRGLAKINGRGKFEVRETTSEDQVLAVIGRLRGENRVRGTMRYSGPTIVNGATQSCDSGKLDWKARR